MTKPARPTSPADRMWDRSIIAAAGPEPPFDAVTSAWLRNNAREFEARAPDSPLLDFASLGGRDAPWLWRVTLRTRGLVLNDDGEVTTTEKHVVAVRFLPDFLRRAKSQEMLALVMPSAAFHPNCLPPAICVEIWPGQPLLEIAQSLHQLLGWRLRQLSEDDALNPRACAWGREALSRGDLLIDDRPLFGRRRISFEIEEVPS